MKHLDIFKWMNEFDIKKVLENSKRISIKKWELIIKEGRDLSKEEKERCFIIVEWSFEISIWKNVMDTLIKGDIFWEIAILAQTRRTANVIALEDWQIIEIEKMWLLALIENSPNKEELKEKVMKRITMNKSLLGK